MYVPCEEESSKESNKSSGTEYSELPLEYSFLILEFLSGESLLNWCENTTHTPPSLPIPIKDLEDRLKTAVECLLDAGVWQLDLRPKNLMVEFEEKTHLE